MKTVMAFIRINKMIPTKRALTAAGITSMTAEGHVQGRGKGYWDAKVMEGAQENRPEALTHMGEHPRLRPQTMIMITVPDDKVKIVVKTIMETNCTGQHGDGKIFVLPEMDAIRVRTGESGDIVLD